MDYFTIEQCERWAQDLVDVTDCTLEEAMAVMANNGINKWVGKPSGRDAWCCAIAALLELQGSERRIKGWLSFKDSMAS